MVRPGPLFFSLLFGDGNRVKDAQRRISRRKCPGQLQRWQEATGRGNTVVVGTFSRVDLSGGVGTKAQSQDE